MTRLFSHRDRAVSLGPFPLERLERVDQCDSADVVTPPFQVEAPDNPLSLANAMGDYFNIMDRMRVGPTAPEEAPIPSDLGTRADHLKAACYYLDVSMAGTCRVPATAVLETPVVNESLAKAKEQEYAAGSAENVMAETSVREGREAWARAQEPTPALEHGYALVILTEYTREPDHTEPGGSWIVGTQPQRAAIRSAEVGAVMVNYLRFLGFDSRLHTATARDVDLNRLAVECGLAEALGSNGSARCVNPFVGERFGLAVVTTTMELAADRPLAPGVGTKSPGFKWWLGVGGTRPGFAGEPFKNRPFHLGQYPMETVKRVAEPTTLIDGPNIPRSPKRRDMFIRAAMGDLGPKAQKELDGFRMITKSPFGHALIPALGGMVPLQYGQEAESITAGTDDPKKNAEAVKAALYYLGADLVGICEIPEHAWYSHDIDGKEVNPYHQYAVCVLIDQGYETMEGASGDDWISGAQSMRAYLRAQLIGGIVGEQIRRLGYSARGHSVMDQDVLHIPLILNSGLGEMPRIGELVLNPFVGPRFKSGIITTDMPLAVDHPIDFGLQDFCQTCRKCARECPVTAIPFGDKIMFNGYEMWKPDVEKCARYRITNGAGSMCGRCMKTCPYNLEGTAAERPFRWAARNLPFARRWIAEFDDKVGNGRINPTKKWWWDLDSDAQGRVIPAKKSNERELVFRPPLDPGEQKLGCYPPDLSPPPVTESPLVPDRKEAMKRYRAATSPEEYRRRQSG
ncbi:MAG TPA: reductive dehalogenase domain-containing protein [Gammaproteobacteria bacterium]|nr:reductive dehalogenase domain-containing protein [Gammaproteobacteria bacterium]